MKRLPQTPPVTAIKCHFCGTESPLAANGPNVLVWADPNGWIWFTGNLQATVHACAKCAKSKECGALERSAYERAAGVALASEKHSREAKRQNARLSNNDTNQGDPRETPEEREIEKLSTRLAQMNRLYQMTLDNQIRAVERADKAKELLDWAESLICNAVPMTHCTQDEWDEAVKKWRDAKHGVAGRAAAEGSADETGESKSGAGSESEQAHGQAPSTTTET